MFLPGGGPQGTIIALLLFLVLINELGFSGQMNNTGETITSMKRSRIEGQIHLKYVDDFSLAESINLRKQLTPGPVGPKPESYHNRTGHVLPNNSSKIHQQLLLTKTYAEDNQMKLNFEKTKLMLFNPSNSIDFQPDFVIDDHQLEMVEELRILGLTVRSDLKWSSNTKNIVKKGNQRLWMVKRLKNIGAKTEDLVDVYIKQIRSVLEFAAPVWQSSLTKTEKTDIERVQKSFCRIVLGSSYQSYAYALESLQLESLEARRINLCLRFALRAEKHQKFKHWFILNTKTSVTRRKPVKYVPVVAKHSRFEKSPLFYLTNLLNTYYS